MKKTLLIAAAALAAGIISSQAQSSVYSQNVVGYYNLNMSAGYNLVANQFAAGVSNGMNEVFPSLPDSTFVYQWNGTGYTINIYDSGAGSTPPSQSWYMSDYSTPTNEPVLKTGQACFLLLPSAVTNTVVGTVLTTNQFNATSGYNMISSALPVGGSTTNSLFNMGSLPDSSFIYTWNGSGYTITIYDSGGGSSPYAQSWYMSDYSTPTNALSLNVGQGAFFLLPSSWSWSQNFTNN